MSIFQVLDFLSFLCNVAKKAGATDQIMFGVWPLICN
jgi:hypothetical protein